MTASHPTDEQWQDAYAKMKTWMEEAARKEGKTGGVMAERQGPTVRKMLGMISAQYAAGKMRVCIHLAVYPEQPAFWGTWRPDRINCVKCVNAAAERIKGTPEDRTCDGCGVLVPEGTPILSGLALLSAKLPYPLSLVTGMCQECHDIEAAADGRPL